MEALGKEVEEIVKVYAGRIVDPLVEEIAGNTRIRGLPSI